MININLKKLFLLAPDEFQEYYNLLSHLNPKAITGFKEIKSITELTFGEVVTIRMQMQEPSLSNLINLFHVIFGIDQEQFYKIDSVSFFHSLNWIREEINKINNLENTSLKSDIDSKLKEAGIEQMAIFKELNTLISIGEKFGVTPQEVENWNYNLVFTLMLHQKKSFDISKKYNELLNPKKP